MEDLIENNIPFEVTNVVGEDSVELTLSGYVYERWTEDDNAIDAKLVRNALDGVDKPIVIKLNSPGGDVFQGIEIYNYLKNHTSHVTVEVTGLAASAASIIAMGADEIIMNTGTSLMVHEASAYARGTKTDIKKVLNALDTIDKSIVDIYADKTNKTDVEINNWINDEKWFTAEEAVEFGLADSIKAKNENEVTNETPVFENKLFTILKNLQTIGGK